jgi:hypothetical protein
LSCTCSAGCAGSCTIVNLAIQIRVIQIRVIQIRVIQIRVFVPA